MVAFAKDYLPAESPARSQNRAECFFARQTCRAAHGAPAVRLNAGENSRCRYDACRGASLAQGGDWKQKVDDFGRVVSRVEDGVRDLTAQPDRNPMVNLAGMRQRDDRRNLWFVSAPLIPAAAGEVYLFATSPLVVAELKSISLAFQASHSQLSQAASYGFRHNVNQVLASPSGVSYGLGETANFFSSWLTNDGIFIPTPGGAAGAVLNNFFPPEKIDLDPDD